MRHNHARPFAAAAVVAVLALGACSSNDDPDPSPSPSAGEGGTTNTIDVVCAEPIGSVTIDVAENEDDWEPGYVVGTDQVLEPVAFGDIVFTNTATGETFTDPAKTKPGASTEGAVECTFTDTVPADDELPQGGTVTGAVTVVEHDVNDWTYTPSAPEQQTVALVCPEPIGAIDVQTDPDDLWAPGYAQTGQVFEPVAFGEMTFTDAATGETQTQAAQTKPGADTAGAVDCTFTLAIPANPDAPQGGTATGTVTVVEHGGDWTYTPVPEPSEPQAP
jgi:hypothetical protein